MEGYSGDADLSCIAGVDCTWDCSKDALDCTWEGWREVATGAGPQEEGAKLVLLQSPGEEGPQEILPGVPPYISGIKGRPFPQEPQLSWSLSGCTKKSWMERGWLLVRACMGPTSGSPLSLSYLVI